VCILILHYFRISHSYHYMYEGDVSFQTK
jgi:hypothetical protein